MEGDVMDKVEATATVRDFDPISGSIPATKVEITVSCRNLLDRDTFSKSDPLVVLYTQGVESKQWREFGRTEVIDNTLNPDFVRKYILDYFFEEKQNLRFDVGIPGKKCGTIVLSAEELGNCRDYATMQFCATKLDKKDFFGKSDPFMVFYRSNEDGTFTICHKTEVVKNTLNPVWQSFSIPVRALCNGDYDRTIKVEVYDWDRDGRLYLKGQFVMQFLCLFSSHDFIGEFTTSYKELCRGQSQLNSYEVVNAKKKIKKKRYINSGKVSLLSFSVESEHTFLDYIKGGTQIHFTVAIDFTASNGNPSQSTSLHYMNPYQMNAYAMALKAVGEIIQDYDSDKMFPALGFGAKLPPDGRVSHEFPLNGNIENPYCNGMEGILEAYHQSLKTVQLYGPTNFAPVVNHVASCQAEMNRNSMQAAVQDGSQYFVLLIITDGVISDMAQTKEAIVNAAKLPMSIIIVGVGQAEFDAMVELDGDDIRISSRGKLAERDIVQFVPFRDYMDRTGNHVLSMARLAKDVLAEIPDQLISYMKSRGIKPNLVPPAYSTGDHLQTNPV
ncbi:Copine-5 [Collichthys lucidus]|uniref:Copine-5 n=1 Tax=Collichthys lucidus TaxID=240159 RepID=A0A4U5UR44_COLLU|nr:Copine-5 [Collichthys lucidus]